MIETAKAGGGNIRPAGHVRPAKSKFLALYSLFDWNLAREAPKKGSMWPADKK